MVPVTGRSVVRDADRHPIHGISGPVLAHAFCFGLRGKGDNMKQKLREFLEKTGPDLSVAGVGCKVPNFEKAGVSPRLRRWDVDSSGNLILPAHKDRGTPTHPKCRQGGMVPVSLSASSQAPSRLVYTSDEWGFPYQCVRANKVSGRVHIPSTKSR